MTVVDVHAHAILPAVEALVADDPRLAAQKALDLRRNGGPSEAASGQMIRVRLPQLFELERRLCDMTAAGVDVQVVSPSPSQYHPWADEELAGRLSRTAATAVAQLVAQAPDRLRGLGLAPLQHPSLMVAALEDAVLGNGLAGVESPPTHRDRSARSSCPTSGSTATTWPASSASRWRTRSRSRT